MAGRLKDEKSQYLRTAASSPIDWYPWGSEAFERARTEDKPILLDIGAVWCHWCHVMDHGTYEDEEVVRRLNEDFVCVKVDRDERPDVDVRYQRAVGAITGQGGWPLTAFLTPEGKVFFGGTYFPPKDAHGRPGFSSVLSQIHDVYKQDRERVDQSAEHVMEAIRKSTERGASQGALDRTVLDHAAKAIVQAHDTRFGGFGTAPKFPHTPAIQLAFALHAAGMDEQLRSIGERTLHKMAAGGIHDRVGGGFHRYSVDAHWTVPHFEKMAYDNAELLRCYADAYARTGDERHRQVALGVVQWVLEVCADREHGGFAGSQDADLGPDDDGDYFTWSLAEFEAALRAEAGDPDTVPDDLLVDIAKRRFGVEERGDMHHDPARNVLEIEATVEDVAKATDRDAGTVHAAEAEALRRLKRARDRREAPFVDPSRFTDWNAMYVSAMLEASMLLDHDEARRQALRTVDRLLAEQWDEEKGWLHRPRVDGGSQVHGLLDDHAWMGVALIDCYMHTGRSDHLDAARRTAERLLEDFAAPAGGYFDTSAAVREAAEAVPLQQADRPWLDQSGPGGNPIAARFLLRLGRLTGDARYGDAAESTLALFADEAPKMGIFAASWALTVHEALSDPPLVTVVGAMDDPATQALVEEALRTPRTGRLVMQVEPGAAEAVPSFLRDVVGNEDLVKEGPRALVCHGDRCDALVGEPGDLRDRILGIPPEA